MRRITDGRCASGDRFNHHRIRTDFRARADRETAQDLRTATHDYAIFQRRVAFRAAFKRCAAERHALINRAIVTDFCRFTNHDAHAVINEHAPSHFRTRMNLNSGQPARYMR